MNFSISKELNVHFVGGPEDDLSKLRLRYLKTELRENPSINASYIRQGVRAFLPGLQKVIDSLPPGSHLLITPSTTNKNRIPALLGTEIKKVRPDIVLINLNEKDVWVAHRSESKLKGNYSLRATDQRHFAISDKLRAAAPQLNRVPTYLLDDSISEGDTTFMLHRELGRAGIQARGGVITAVAREHYHVRESDLDRLYKKMQVDRPPGYPDATFRQDLFTVFAGFPRKRLTNFERAYNTGNDHHRKDIAFSYIQQVAGYLVAEKLDPAHVLSRRQQEAPEVSLTKKLRTGPKL